MSNQQAKIDRGEGPKQVPNLLYAKLKGKLWSPAVLHQLYATN